MIDVKITIDDEETVQALRQIRREFRSTVIKATIRAAKFTVLPLAVSLAPSFAKSQMFIKGSTRRTVLTVRTRSRKKRAILAVANFGGTIRAPILPTRAQALRLNDGTFVMRVTGPRRIEGKHWMEQAVNRGRDRFHSRAVREVEKSITRKLGSVGAFG